MFQTAQAPEETVRDLYDDALRESLHLLWSQRLQITLTKQQIFRVFGSEGPTPRVTRLLEALDTMLVEKINHLRDKLSEELTTSGPQICKIFEAP